MPAVMPAPEPFLLVPAPLQVDGLAQVVADRLRMRSGPEVSPSSERLEPLLERGTGLFVIAGPVAGSGYEWYLVTPIEDRADEFRYRVDVVPVGWVAAADKDGTSWLSGAAVDCPDPAAFYEDLSLLERLGPLAGLSCYGNRDLSFRATPTGSGFVDGYGSQTYTPGWLVLPERFRFWRSTDDPATPEPEPYETALSPTLAPRERPDFETSAEWDVVGHFNDPAAASCRIEDPEHERAVPVDDRAVVLMCRTTMVVTELRPFSGIDPG
jgi:hypothetical protein